MRRRAILSALVLVLLAAYLAINVTAADNEPSKEGATVDPQKVFIIYTASPSKISGGGVIITSLRREVFLGIPCLVGEGVEGWGRASGRTFRVPISQVATIMEFDDIETWQGTRTNADGIILTATGVD
ncbi:MAG: hypothetical protein JW959_05655 [Pirellulales bacterium]|nr:hypothetical protein [Pirellulales bacterium]